MCMNTTCLACWSARCENQSVKAIEVQSYTYIAVAREMGCPALRTCRSFKTLVMTSPCHVAMVITGSTMAAVWANFAQTPTNGLALISHNVALHLPGYSDAAVMRSTWEQLEQEYKQLPAALRAQSLPGYAILIWLVKVWVDAGRPWVSNTYVLRTYEYKLFPEVRAHCCPCCTAAAAMHWKLQFCSSCNLAVCVQVDDSLAYLWCHQQHRQRQHCWHMLLSGAYPYSYRPWHCLVICCRLLLT